MAKRLINIKKAVKGTKQQFQGKGVGSGLGQYAFLNNGANGSVAVINEVFTPTTLGGQKVVAIQGGVPVLGDSSTLAHCDNILGLTVTAASAGTEVKIITQGFLESVGWGLTPDAVYFLGTSGAITATPPTTGFIQKVGFAISADILYVDIDNPIKLV